MAQSKSPRRKRTPDPPPTTTDEKIIAALMPWRAELAGLGLFLFSVLTLLALPGWTQSTWLGAWAGFLREAFGWGAYPLFLSFAAGGLHVALRRIERPYHATAAQVIGFELLWLTALPLSYQFANTTLVQAHTGKGGGLVGWALSEPLIAFFGPILTGLFYVSLFCWGMALIFQVTMQDVQQGLRFLSAALREWAQAVAPPEPVETETEAAAPAAEAVERPSPSEPPAPAIPIVDEGEEEDVASLRRSKKLPSLDMLKESVITGISEAEIARKKEIIEQTLADFGIPAEVTQVQRGPAVTQFGVLPGYVERTGPDGEPMQKKVRVNQIAALQRDLALALAVPRLRVQAPVPGQGVVGVEVPNDDIAMVRLRAILESEAFNTIRSPLVVGLGRDVAGHPVAIDLGKLPHLLIAGATGSGKSICINALITALVFNNTPDKLNLIMIDPKKVELIRFNGLPHLIGSVEVEADRAVGVLRWLTAEMDRRYELFEQVNARNLGGYNRRVAGHETLKKLPYIAVFIDELADLMHIYPGDVERTLCRLAQMARATGIHLVVATQRPSTDVITGLIKANFPARLSFSVASGTDSRVILDTVGAEHLLGQGDALFLAPDASGPLRTQGVFVSDQEIERVVRFWQTHSVGYEPIPCPWDSLIAKFAVLDETDMLLEQAIEIAQKRDTLSTSYLQRRLRIGYPRAARIMEHLYEMGLVEDPKSGGKTRKTMVDEEDNPMQRIIEEWDEDE